jgi:hypothetical protein
MNIGCMMLVNERFDRSRRTVIDEATRMIERGIMKANERVIRFVFVSGFVAVMALEVWLLFRAIEMFF